MSADEVVASVPEAEAAEHVILDMQPTLWPECPTCGEAWLYRRAMSFTTGGYLWCWMRGCKHKVSAVLMTDDGEWKAPADV